MLNQDLRRFAPFGLILALVALIAAAVLYIIQQSFALPVQISLALVVLGLALAVLLNPQKAREVLTGRQARYGSNALVLTLAFVGIVVVINYIIFHNSKQWDLTEDQTNTLAPESLQVLASLKTPVVAEAYYSPNYPIGTTRDLLDNYKRSSQGKFDYEVIDPIQNPVRANEANVTRDGTIVLKSEGRSEQVSYASEQEISAALVRLANPGERVVYFLTGHGEFDINGTDRQSAYSFVKRSLTAKNYTVNTLNLLADPKVPEDALAVIAAGPQKPLGEAEVTAIQTYLDQGGSLVYLADPRPITQFGDQPDPMAAYLEKSWGIQLHEDMIVDLNNAQQPLVAIGAQFGQHPITQKMVTSAIFLPYARSLADAGAPEGVTLTALAMTTQQSWGETDYASLNQQQVSPDQSKDLMGPLTLAFAGVNNNTQGRVVVIGNAGFASDQNFAAYGNGDFLLNSIDWAAEQENLINLTPKQTTQRMLVITDRLTSGLILFGSIFLLPGLIVLTGISVWIQRRRRG